ncbi:MAG: hypothetical protein HY342_11360 [Candidatus Lambdaproteobacteria bacterium]|nr:hypothetical protein [Candidatus Lambdaproteobacteria bacterium]
MKTLEMTPRQREIWTELCDMVEIDPHWLENTLNEYYRIADEYGLIEMSDELLNVKYEFGWVEHAMLIMTE